jgi:hypothetical protein
MFATDNNGVLIQLPSVPDGGLASVQGSLIFGIGTESNNGLGSAQVYTVPGSLDKNPGDFTTTFNGSSYPGFLDSGSNAFFFVDSSIPTCNKDWFCPTTSPLVLSAQNQGTNMSSGVQVGFTIENENNLSGSNTAFSTLAGPYKSTPAAFDWGLSFFYGRNVFTAIENIPAGTGPYFAY